MSDNHLVVCKYCGSSNIVRYGTYNNVQRWWCKDCKRKFKEDDTLFHMKTPANQVSSALNMYFEGMSHRVIRRQLELEHKNSPSSATIYEWVDKYTDIGLEATKNLKPKVGNTFICDETMLEIDGKNVWLFDYIDADTRFLLSSRLAYSRTTHDARMLLEEAAKKAGKTPKYVVTDKLRAYIDGMELAFGADAEHIQSRPFTVKDSTNLIERWQQTLKMRTKVMRGLNDINTALQFLDGFIIHYNYLRPHEALKGKTPAEVADIDYDFKSWSDITRLPVKVKRLSRPKVTLRLPRSGKPLKHKTRRLQKPVNTMLKGIRL